MLLSLATAPVMGLLFYLYIRDKYEKEPWRMLVISVLFGIVITAPIVYVGNLSLFLLPQHWGLTGEAFFSAFVVSGFVEEVFKFGVLFLLTWKSPELNEKFDGIVYGVYVSLGFAFVENLLYVMSDDLGGVSTALSRGVISVPGHALFGVFMGYFFTRAKWTHHGQRQTAQGRVQFLALALGIPVVIHGVYNVLLLTGVSIYVFLVYVALLYYGGAVLLKLHSEASPFKLPEKSHRGFF